MKPVVLVPTLLLLIGTSASAQPVATPPLSRSGSPLSAASPAGASAGGGARSPGGMGTDATSEALVQTVADISGKATPGARDYRRLTEATLDFARRKAMGGEGSMAKWVTMKLAEGDLMHPTRAGAQLLGTWLHQALMQEYRKYRAR